MKTIEQLTDETGLWIEYDNKSVTVKELEFLCKAYMADRFSDLKPVAYKYKWDENLEWHFSEYLANRDYYKTIALYDLTELKAQNEQHN